MKRVLFAISPSAEMGGAQNVFVATIKELSREDFEITVILPDETLLSSLDSCDIDVHIVNFRSAKCLMVIHRLLKEGEFDIVNTYQPQCSIRVALVNLFHHVPICCTLLNAVIHEKLNRFQKTIYPIIYFILHKMCDGFIVNSEQNKRHFAQTARISREFIKVIYSGIEMDAFENVPEVARRNSKFAIGYIGRLSPEKGPRYLLEALSYLKAIDYECIIVGDGPLRTELEDYINLHNLQEKVRMLGFQKKIAPLIKQMDVVVVPSLNETFGITIIEAFAIRKAVVASNAGGIPEVVEHKKTGLLFAAGDALALSDQILYVHNNKTEADEMGKNGHEYFMQNFTSSIMARNTLDYFNSLAQL